MNTAIIIWLSFAGCLVLSFLLSGMEAGVFALSRLRIRQQMRAGRLSAKLLHDYLENPENFLWTILVGNTVANFMALGWLAAELYRVLHGHPMWFGLVFLLLVLVFYALSDLLPKMLFRAYPTRLCLSLARPFRWIHVLLRPLVALVEGVSDWLLRWRGGKAFTGRLFGNREELRLLMHESAQGFTSEERAMINRVLDLESVTVRQAMTPLAKAAIVKAGEPLGRALELCRGGAFTRLPVLEERDGRSRVVGLINLNALLFQPALDLSRPVRELARPALYVEEDVRLEVALHRMQRSGHRLAVVLGRERRETGIISLEDILKFIFGEVRL